MTQSLNNTAKAIIIEDTFDRGELFGNLDCNLKLIEEHLGVVIIQRDNMLTIKGDKLETAEKVINELMTLIEKGEKLDTQKVTYIIDLCKQGISYAESHMDKDIVCYTHMGKPLKPKTLGQKYYIKSMRNKDVVFGIGPAGTGKTYLAVAMAVNAFKKKDVQKIILARPAVEAGERLGFLPGDLQDKVDPYLRPLYDALYDILGRDTALRLKEKEIIEVVPLAYMRGRTLDNSFIILDEAQNTTREQMKMFLTRMGFGSKVVVTGDVTQIDLPRGKTSGLTEAVRVLKGVDDIDFCFLKDTDVVRHELVKKIINAYDKYYEKNPPKEE
ncbi:MAG: PhoH family protein [Anaerovoracaceae bacterium]|nr:PhoH family protein [Clostridiales bacterium]MDY2934425.1 PhoH family protein [Anaerovoracaceae bacterium]